MPESVKTDVDLSQYPHINRGLEGIVAFTTNKSAIDGQKGKLIYAGYSIDDLAEHASFEEVCFLLWNNRLPNKDELDDLTAKLQKERAIPETVKNYLRNTPDTAEPMGVLRTAVSMLADTYDRKEVEDRSFFTNKAISIVAKMPTIVAGFERARQGKDLVDPLEDQSAAHNFLYMLNNEHPGSEAEKTMNLALVLHAEHGMNASTFTSRTICSTESDMFSAVTGAIGALKGPLHGGANQAVMAMLRELDAKGDDADPVQFVKNKLDNKEKISGFGHRVYRTMDPRAVHLRKMSKKLTKETGTERFYEWSESILETMKSEKDIDPNVDFFSATVYHSMGISSDMFTCIFAMSRAAGWTGHFIEQAENNRLIRPRALYIDDRDKKWIPLEER